LARNTISTAEASRDSAANNWRERSERLFSDGCHPSDALLENTCLTVLNPDVLDRGFVLVGETLFVTPSEARAARKRKK